jgi:hypothetical protein
LFKKRISARQKNKKEKKEAEKRPDLVERRGKVYVLPRMVTTFPTCHLERSPLKALAL